MEYKDNLNSFVNTGRPGRSGVDIAGAGAGGGRRWEWRQARQLSDQNVTFKWKSRVFHTCNMPTGL